MAADRVDFPHLFISLSHTQREREEKEEEEEDVGGGGSDDYDRDSVDDMVTHYARCYVPKGF